jgi:hypothetical protein
MKTCMDVISKEFGKMRAMGRVPQAYEIPLPHEHGSEGNQTAARVFPQDFSTMLIRSRVTLIDGRSGKFFDDLLPSFLSGTAIMREQRASESKEGRYLQKKRSLQGRLPIHFRIPYYQRELCRHPGPEPAGGNPVNFCWQISPFNPYQGT